jgi:hypothetical protein
MSNVLHCRRRPVSTAADGCKHHLAVSTSVTRSQCRSYALLHIQAMFRIAGCICMRGLMVM